MSGPPKKLIYLIERAAELRAAGNSWEQTGQKLGKSGRTVRTWRYRYRAFWDQTIAAARREVAADAADEGLAILRSVARSDDEKVRRDASARLVDLRTPDDDAPAGNNELIRFVEFLESLTDDQLDSLLGVEHRGDDPRSTGGSAETPGPASVA